MFEIATPIGRRFENIGRLSSGRLSRSFSRRTCYEESEDEKPDLARVDRCYRTVAAFPRFETLRNNVLNQAWALVPKAERKDRTAAAPRSVRTA
jgi:hypothetical protein